MSLDGPERRTEATDDHRIQSLLADLEARNPHRRQFLSRPVYLAASMAKTGDEPLVKRKALAFANLLEKMEIRISDEEYLVGDYPRETPDDVDTGAIETAENLLKPYNARHVFRERNEAFFTKMGNAGNPFAWRAAHIIVDYPKALGMGLRGLIEEVGSYEDSAVDADARSFYQACRIGLNAAQNFTIRYADHARTLAQDAVPGRRADELREIARICTKISADPPQTFHEALQLLWLLHLWVYLEAPGAGNSLGRFDQFMLGYYKRDISSGRLTPEVARELLKCFWIKLNELAYGQSSENVTVGGRLNDGRDGTNPLTHLALRTTREIPLRLPHLSVRIHRDTPDDLLDQIVETVAAGAGQPQVYNDDVIIPSLIDQGIPRSVATDYAIQGCIQTYLPGVSAPWSDVYLNFGKCLELALNNGRSFPNEPKPAGAFGAAQRAHFKGPTIGPETGRPEDFTGFEDVYQAFQTQMRHFLDVMAESRAVFDHLLPEADALPFASTLIGDCLSRGRDAYSGGARYRLSGIYLVGMATVADSLGVIRDIMEGENRPGVTLAEFISELKNNFGTNPNLRQWALSVAKYGNDLDGPDDLAVRVTDDFCNEILSRATPDGTHVWPILSSYFINVRYGHATSATPDGRLAGEPLSNTLCPSFGQDKFGPTAIIRSTCKIDFNKSVGGAVLNMRFLPNQLRSKEGKAALVGLLRTYVDLGGWEVQINCVDNKTLRDAQANPARHPNLLVRVSGFCAKFVTLPRDLQDEVIARTELELA